MGSTPRGISASRGAAVLGLSDWASPREVWQLIQEERQPGYNAAHGYTLPEFKDGAILRWGLAFEDALCALDEEVLGKRVCFREGLYCRGFDLPDIENEPVSLGDNVITCHIDGCVDGALESPLVLVENKTTTAFAFREKWGEPGSDRIPQVYQVQVQHQMLCTGASEVIVSVLVFPEMPDEWEKMGVAVEKDGDLYVIRGPKLEDGFHAWTCSTLDWARPLARMGYFHQYRVKANPEAQAAMLAAYRDFWEHNVLGEVPPDPRDYEDVRRLFPAPKGTIVCDDTLAGWLREYKDIRDELGGKGMLSRRADELKVLILERARATDGTIDDESREKTIFRDQSGQKLGQYDGKTFRV